MSKCFLPRRHLLHGAGIASGVLLAFFGTEIASAQLPVLCTGLPGCGAGPANVIVGAGIPLIAQIFLNSSAALSVIFVVIGGAQFLGVPVQLLARPVGDIA